jgi:hypothetical protein
MRPTQTIGRLAIALLIVALTAIPILAATGLLLSAERWRRPAGTLADTLAEQLTAQAIWLDILSEPRAVDGHVMDGRLRAARPRILLPGLAAWSGYAQPALLAARERAYEDQAVPGVPPLPCAYDAPLWLAACYVSTGDAESGRRGLVALERFALVQPEAAGQYGNAWRLALAYDLLVRHPLMTPRMAQAVEARLEAALTDLLAVLDDDEASLWHGRATLAGHAWLTAAVLTPGPAERDRLVARAQAHFREAMAALRLTEAWPEGYSYWIRNRALPLVLAATAYLNGLENAAQADAIRALLVRVGLWHVYATRPDNRIEGLGDEGAPLDLRGLTRPVIDLIVQATGDPVLAGYSRYLGALHGQASYAPGLHWAFRLFNDPAVAPWPGTGEGDLASLGYALPQAEIFGRGAMNQAYIRSGWGADDTFISFRAGDVFTHHGHYDAGHFTLFHGAPLAVDGSVYGDFFGLNRLHYSIRTVAKNSLLILRPGERVQPTIHFFANVAGGGQRVVLPTGSAILDTGHWRRNLDDGLHLRGGEIRRFAAAPDRYAYLMADLTPAYNTPANDEGGVGGKALSVRRELFYLFEENVLLVHDDVSAAQPDYLAKWLLHSVARPQADGLRVLRGAADDGILETDAALAVIRNDRSYLTVHRLLPADGVIRLVGGPNHRYYVEYDGNDRALDGANIADGAARPDPARAADWRIEIQPAEPRQRTHFLVALVSGLDRPAMLPVTPLAVSGAAAWGAEVGETAVIFVGSGAEGPLVVDSPAAERLYVVGLPPGARLTTVSESERREMIANGDGVAYSRLEGLAEPLRISW